MPFPKSTLVRACNKLAALAKHQGPKLTVDSDARRIEEWLSWSDKDGDYEWVGQASAHAAWDALAGAWPAEDLDWYLCSTDMRTTPWHSPPISLAAVAAFVRSPDREVWAVRAMGDYLCADCVIGGHASVFSAFATQNPAWLVIAWVALPDLEDSDTCGHCKRGLHMPEMEVRKHLDSVFDSNHSTAKPKLEDT